MGQNSRELGWLELNDDRELTVLLGHSALIRVA